MLEYDYSRAHVFLATLCMLAVNVCGCVHLVRLSSSCARAASSYAVTGTGSSNMQVIQEDSV